MSQTVPAAPNVEDQHTALGAIPQSNGVLFRVWAPHADAVCVMGTFNDWDRGSHPCERDEQGNWSLLVEQAGVGDEYLFVIHSGENEFTRIDPRARCVTNSVGNAIVVADDFDWDGDDFQIAPLNELVIYELHIGTFGRKDGEDGPAGFDDAISCLDHLRRLGVNCIEVMPVAEFAGDYSWGYNPAHIFSVESAYGGPDALKRFIHEAHARGIAVILDVVYNHFGPSDLSLWHFDGWSENGGGGIYFYNDWRAETPWGATRPDYGRGEVRQYIYDNAMMWLEDFHVDGLRYDMTLYMRNVRGNGDPGADLPDGWSLGQWINSTVRERFPRKILIAEDLQKNDWMTKSVSEGGLGFHSQWDAHFVHPLRAVLTEQQDEHRSLDLVKEALLAQYNGDPFQRVVYTESHDEVANGKARMPTEVMPHDPRDWFAVKRAALGGALVLTAPGVPMLFQGQEFIEDGWFRDTVPVDWDKAEDFHGIVRMFRDLVRLRLNRAGATKGLTGSHIAIIAEHHESKLIAFHRWYDGGPGDDVVVVANFRREPGQLAVPFPADGEWKLRLNSDSTIYHDRFSNTPAANVTAAGQPVELEIGPYAVLVYSQDQ